VDGTRVISMYRGSIANILVNITRIIVSTGQISSIGRLGSIPQGSITSIGWSSRVAMAYTSRSSVSSIYSGAVSSTSIG